MNLIKSCCLFVVFSSFLACTPQVSDVKSMSYTEFYPGNNEAYKTIY